MKSLLPLAVLGAASFATLAGHFAHAPDALACGDYTNMTTKLTAADVELAVSLLEKQVPERLTALEPAQPERRIVSRAAPRPRPERRSSVIVMSYQAPRVGDRAWLESKTVLGELTLSAPDTARATVPYRIHLANEAVELRRGTEWVAVADWTH